MRADPGFFSVVANGPLILADRDEALKDLSGGTGRGRPDRLAVRHPRRGALAWLTLLQRGELTEAEASLRNAIESRAVARGRWLRHSHAGAWLGPACSSAATATARGRRDAVTLTPTATAPTPGDAASSSC